MLFKARSHVVADVVSGTELTRRDLELEPIGLPPGVRAVELLQRKHWAASPEPPTQKLETLNEICSKRCVS